MHTSATLVSVQSWSCLFILPRPVLMLLQTSYLLISQHAPFLYAGAEDPDPSASHGTPVVVQVNGVAPADVKPEPTVC